MYACSAWSYFVASVVGYEQLQITGTSSLHLFLSRTSFNLGFEKVLKRKGKNTSKQQKEKHVNRYWLGTYCRKKNSMFCLKDNKGHIAVVGFACAWGPLRSGGHLCCKKLPQCLSTLLINMDCATWRSNHQSVRVWQNFCLLLLFSYFSSHLFSSLLLLSSSTGTFNK